MNGFFGGTFAGDLALLEEIEKEETEEELRDTYGRGYPLGYNFNDPLDHYEEEEEWA